jgi:hypothetical protein
MQSPMTVLCFGRFVRVGENAIVGSRQLMFFFLKYFP